MRPKSASRFAARFCLFLAGLALACKFEGDGVPFKPQSRMFPSGEGPVIHFDVSGEAGPLRVRSTDVQVQRHYSSLYVNFGDFDVTLAGEETKEVQADNVTVRVYKPSPEGDEKLVGESHESIWIDSQTPQKPHVSTDRDVQVEISNAGKPCDDGCIVAVVLEYTRYTSTREALGGLAKMNFGSGTSAEVCRTVINLKAGTAQRGTMPAATTSPSAATTSASPVATSGDRVPPSNINILGGCAFLTEEEASRVFSHPMKYRDVAPGSNHCTIAAGDGSGLVAFFFVGEGNAYMLEEISKDFNRESAVIGDRAFWLPTITSLNLARGNDLIVVRMGEQNKPLTADAQAKEHAIALAQAVLSKM